MADDGEDGLSPVDQGTLLMLCLSFGLAILAGLWFACRWYSKKNKKNKKTTPVRIQRPRLKQTFSRFSQVDEELTMHNINEQDAEILQTYSVQSINDPKTHVVHVEPQQTTPVTQTRVTVTESKKPYLETDI